MYPFVRFIVDVEMNANIIAVMVAILIMTMIITIITIILLRLLRCCYYLLV